MDPITLAKVLQLSMRPYRYFIPQTLLTTAPSYGALVEVPSGAIIFDKAYRAQSSEEAN